MSLIACPECKKEVSDQATNCPHCGHPLKTTEQTQEVNQTKTKKSGCLSAILVVGGIIIVFAIISAIFSGGSNNDRPKAPKSPEIIKMEKQHGEMPKVSSWDNCATIVKRYVRTIANDPSSIDFQYCSRLSWNTKDGWLQKASFRGKNAFGGTVLNTKWFVMRYGRVIQMKPANAYR